MTLLALALACVGLVVAGPASAVRSKRGAKPSVTILTKDVPAALKAKRLRLRVGVGIAPARMRIRGLGLDLGPRPIRIVKETKLTFRRRGSRVLNLKLTPEARRLLEAGRNACRDARISAFVATRRFGRKRDDQRTTLVRHSKTLRHGQKSGCGAPGVPGAPDIPGSPGSTPGQGGQSLDPPGTPPRPAPPVPTDPITIRAGAADADSTPPTGTPMFAYTARSRVLGPETDPPFDPEDPAGSFGIDPVLQFIGDPDPNLYAKSFRASNGIHTRIRARAIVVESGGKKFVLAMVDLGGHPLSFTQEVVKRVADLGISADRFFLSSTHTHSSSGAIWSADNMGYGVAGGDVYDPRVFDMVVQGVVDAIRTANERLQPARIGVGTATLRGASRNRGHDAFQLNPDAPANEKASSNAAVDQRVTVIRVDDANGAPMAAWSNFAIHPVSFGDENLLFSGDNAATAERLVEDEILRDARDARRPPRHPPVNVWTNGAEGDVSPDGGIERDATEPQNSPRQQLEHSPTSFSSANVAGRKVSRGIVEAWRDAGTAMSGSPPIDVRHTYMSLDASKQTADGNLAAFPVLGLGVVVDPIPFPFSEAWPTGERPCAPPGTEPSGPGQGNKFPLVAAPGGVPSVQPASLMRIGPLAVAAFPTEITTQAGRRITNAITGVAAAQAPEGAIIAGLTNGYNSYTATTDEYPHCHYEAGFTLWGRAQNSYYRDLAAGLANSLFTGAPGPPSAAEPPQVSPGTPNNPTGKPTPQAGGVVAQPADSVKRLGQATFRWNGGDPAIDAPRGGRFVTLEYDNPRTPVEDFAAVAHDDSVMDTTQVDHKTGVWTETWQFTECDALGRYRFHVRGRAVRDGPEEGDYEAISEPFTLTRAGIGIYSTKVENGVARVRAEYTGLPNNALAVLNRRVRHGVAILRITRPGGASEEVEAPIDSRRIEFARSIPAGASATALAVEDLCGNTGS